jgi:hypothetical protein
MSCFALQLIPVGSISDGTFWQLPFHTDLCQAHPPMTQVSGAPRVVLQVHRDLLSALGVGKGVVSRLLAFV